MRSFPSLNCRRFFLSLGESLAATTKNARPCLHYVLTGPGNKFQRGLTMRKKNPDFLISPTQGIFFSSIYNGIFWMFKSPYWHDAGVGLFFKDCFWRG